MKVVGAERQFSFGEEEFDYRGYYVVSELYGLSGRLFVWKSLKGGAKPGYLYSNEGCIIYIVDGKDFPSQKEAYEHIQKVIQDVLDGNIDLKLVLREVFRDISNKLDSSRDNLSHFENSVLHAMLKEKIDVFRRADLAKHYSL